MIKVNRLYFSDGYGLKKINLIDLVGESETQVQIVTTPILPGNGENIIHIHGNRVSTSDDYDIVCLNYSDSYGTVLMFNETSYKQFRDGYHIDRAQVNDDGTLYHINRDLNQIEVFYGVHTSQSPTRAPDYIYSSTSTPALFNGTIIQLYVVSDASLLGTGNSRMYVGSSLGLSIVDTRDGTSDGYSVGLEHLGRTRTYSIVGGGAQYEAIGGTVPRVSSISSNDDLHVCYIVTNDGSGNGGLTQISLEGNSKLVFADAANYLVPSNDIRSVWKHIPLT